MNLPKSFDSASGTRLENPISCLRLPVVAFEGMITVKRPSLGRIRNLIWGPFARLVSTSQANPSGVAFVIAGFVIVGAGAALGVTGVGDKVASNDAPSAASSFGGVRVGV